MPQDLRFALRMLARNPGFAAVAAATLALGVGAHTAIFSLVNANLLRSLPYPDPGRIVMLWGAGHAPFSPPDFFDYQRQNRAFAHLAAVNGGSLTLTGAGDPEPVRTLSVTPEFFDVLGVRPAFGRAFFPQDAEPGRNHVLVITYGAWQRRFGAQRGVIGSTLTLNLLPYTIVGVLPPDFDFSIPGYVRPGEFFTPAVLPHDERERGNAYLRVIGRLKPGVSPAQAQADLRVIDRRLAAAYPRHLTEASTRLVTLREQTVGGIRRVLLVLLGAVSFVLLIACANVANLLLARASARRKEIAIRAALGAGRRRVMAQLLTESLLLAALGGALGAGLGWGLLRACARFAPPGQLPLAAALDGRVLAYAAAVTLATGLLFGLAPALQSSSLRLAEALQEGGRASSRGGGGRLRGGLMAGEIALSLVLLAGSGLLIRSFLELRSVRAGFEPGHLLTMFVQLPAYAYRTAPERVAFYQRTLAELGNLPGVTAIGGIDDLPLTHDRDSGPMAVEGRPPVTVDRLPEVEQRSVTPGYFRAMGIPLIAGREIRDTDTAGSQPVILVNQALARHVFPGEDPVGQRVTWDLPGPAPVWMTVAGVVGDVRDLGLDSQAGDEAYQPFTQATHPYLNVVMRTAGDPAALVGAARETYRRLNRGLPRSVPRTMREVLAQSLAARRFQMLLLSLFAAIALLLASVGIYGVVSYSVAQRTGEIGLRMALGAARRDVLKLVIGRSLLLAGIGIGAGALATLGLAKTLSSMLYGVGAFDPVTLAGVALLLTAVAALASYLPARRAMRVDPVVALRNG